MDSTCPLCGQPRTDEHHIEICGGCHHVLHARDLAPRTTGEFTIEQVMQAAAEHDRAEVHQADPAAGQTCSWCGKLGNQVKKLLSQGGLNICNECIALCSDIMLAELGDGWRK